MDSRHRGVVADGDVVARRRRPPLAAAAPAAAVTGPPVHGRRDAAGAAYRLCHSDVVAASDAGAGGHPFAGDPVFDLHVGGKMEVRSTVALTDRAGLSLAYTPGVARVCEAIAADPAMTQHYTWVPHTVAGRHRRHRRAGAR